MEDFYKDSEIKVNNQYVSFAAKNENCSILIYLSNKVVFQGNNEAYEASIWNQSKPDKTSNVTLPQSGSDEVGTGDYFGPVCVCASYIDENIYKKLLPYDITDSKKLTDAYILKIGKEVAEIVPHSLLILSNEKYNEIHKTTNMNAIKAKLHNSAYLHLKKKIKQMPSFNVVDQFAEEGLYYHYLKNEKEVFHHLHFETKAEAKYIAVGASSIISRYAFLKTMEDLSAKYHMDIPKGAGQNVDEFAKEFVATYGKEELYKVAKVHFANTKKLDGE